MHTLKSPLFFCITLIILNALDVVTTLHGLSVGAKELNPLFPHHNILAKLALPVVFSILLLTAYVFCENHEITLGLRFLKWNVMALNVLYLIIVTSNVTQILMRG